MTKYLDQNGLAYFWTKIKAIFAKASEVLPLTGGTLTGAVTGTDLTLSGDLTVDGKVEIDDDVEITGDIVASDASILGDLDVQGGLTVEDESYFSDSLHAWDSDYIIELTDVEKDVAPSANKYTSAFGFSDKNHVFLAGVSFCDWTGNNQGLQIGISKSDYAKQNLLYFGMDDTSDHKASITMTHPKAWMDALSKSDGAQSYGGTDVITPGSGITIGSATTIWRWGRFVWLRLEYYRNVATSFGANGDCGNYNVGTLKHFKPVGYLHTYSTWESNAHSTKCQINGDGTINCTGGEAANSAYSVAANTWFGVDACFISQADPT